MELEQNKVIKGQPLASNGTHKSSRGEKCLAKFTSSNGSVFGSLTLDIRKAIAVSSTSIQTKYASTCVICSQKLCHTTGSLNWSGR